MKLFNAPTSRPLRLPKEQREHYPPQREIRELAEEFGIGPWALHKRMEADPNGPRPSIRGKRSTDDAKILWYDPAAVRTWWAARSSTKKD